MKKIRQFLIWVSGRNPRTDGKNMVSFFASILIILISLGLGFLTFAKSYDYFSELEKVKKERLMGRIGEDQKQKTSSEAVSTDSLSNKTSKADTASADRETIKPSQGVVLKPSEKLLKAYSFEIAIFLALFSTIFFFFLLRLISSVEGKVDRLTRFFWWCAGANLNILQDCPNDHSKYYGIGGTIFFTSLMATFAGGYAFYTAFHNLSLSIIFGLFWGAVIFNLDRYIVSSTGKGDGTAKITRDEWMNALPRLVLAIVIGIVISTPLELKIFEREINVEIQKMINEERKNIKGGLADLSQDIQRKKDRIAELTQEEQRVKAALLGQDPRIILSQNNKEALSKERNSIDRNIDRNQRFFRQYNEAVRFHQNQLESEGLTEEQRSSIQRKLERAESNRNTYGSIIRSLQGDLREINNQINEEEQKVNSIQTDLSKSYTDILEKNKNERERINQEIKELEELLSSKNQEADDVSIQFNGLMARLLAIKRLSYTYDTIYQASRVIATEPLTSQIGSRDSAELDSTIGLTDQATQQILKVEKTRTPVFYAKWLIAALIICIEIAPILFKMMTEAGAYENRVEAEKVASESLKLKHISDVNERINLELSLNREINESKKVAEREANRRLLEAIADAQAEIAKEAIEEWKNQQLEKIRENPSLIIQTQEPT